jgi:hypothetical protein
MPDLSNATEIIKAKMVKGLNSKEKGKGKEVVEIIDSNAE